MEGPSWACWVSREEGLREQPQTVSMFLSPTVTAFSQITESFKHEKSCIFSTKPLGCEAELAALDSAHIALYLHYLHSLCPWSPRVSSCRARVGVPLVTCHPITRPARGTCLVLPNACWVVQNSGGLSSRTKKRNTRWLLEKLFWGGLKGPWMLKVFRKSLVLSAEVGFGEEEWRGECASLRTASYLPRSEQGCTFLKQKSPGWSCCLVLCVRFGNLPDFLTTLQRCVLPPDFHNHFLRTKDKELVPSGCLQLN